VFLASDHLKDLNFVIDAGTFDDVKNVKLVELVENLLKVQIIGRKTRQKALRALANLNMIC